MDLFYSLSGLINALTSLTLGLLLFCKNKKSKVNQTFALLCISVATWSFAYMFWPLATTKEEALFWFQTLHIGSSFFSIAYLHFVTTWLGIYKQNKVIIIFGYFLAAFFALSVYSPWFITDVVPKYSMEFWPEPGIQYHFYLLMFFGYAIYSTILLIIHYRKSYGIKKTQIKFLLIGLTAAYLAGSTNYFLFYDINIPPYVNGLVIIYVILTAYAITRYRLMDIRIVIKKSVFYIFALTILMVFSILLFVLLQNFLEDYLKVDPKISVAILVVILILVLPKIRDYIKDQFDNIFHKEYIDFYERIKNLDKSAQFSTQLSDLTREISVELKKMLKVEHVEFYTLDKRQNEFVCRYPKEQEKRIIKNGLFTALNSQKEIIIKEELNYIQPKNKEEKKEIKELTKNLEKLNSAAAIPIFSGQEFIGIILISQKQGKENFSKEDLDLMNLMVGKMGDILANVMLYQESIENIRINQQQA